MTEYSVSPPPRPFESILRRSHFGYVSHVVKKDLKPISETENLQIKHNVSEIIKYLTSAERANMYFTASEGEPIESITGEDLRNYNDLCKICGKGTLIENREKLSSLVKLTIEVLKDIEFIDKVDSSKRKEVGDFLEYVHRNLPDRRTSFLL